jgi:hypothetical protein
MSHDASEPVAFVSAEAGSKDLIVSFALTQDDEGDIACLVLIRTPAYEPQFSPEHRGLTVSYELDPETEPEYDRVRRIQISHDRMEITTIRRGRYLLDVSGVDPDEMRDVVKVLRKMNFDRNFELDSAA